MTPPQTRRARRIGRVGAAALALVLTVLAGCGGDSGSGDGAGATGTSAAAELEHVHGLGVEPAGGAVLVATHRGLFRLAPGESTPVRVGDTRYDLMGFAVTAPDVYLASGHPDPSSDLPASLGLLQSHDAGATWHPVSLLGEADLHVLRASGRRVVGVDSHGGEVLVSRDAGATWTRNPPPAPLVDLVIDPARPDRLVASTQTRLVASGDAGRSWRPLGPQPGYLAWPAQARLYRMSPDGTVDLSSDGGATWTRRGTAGAAPAVFAAAGRDRLLAVTQDGDLAESRDGGRTWRLRAALT